MGMDHSSALAKSVDKKKDTPRVIPLCWAGKVCGGVMRIREGGNCTIGPVSRDLDRTYPKIQKEEKKQATWTKQVGVTSWLGRNERFVGGDTNDQQMDRQCREILVA
jgi:hypothetical protein